MLRLLTAAFGTRFPPPWSVEELDACFVVRDHNGQLTGVGLTLRLFEAAFCQYQAARRAFRAKPSAMLKTDGFAFDASRAALVRANTDS